jgi:hypothetical protein
MNQDDIESEDNTEPQDEFEGVYIVDDDTADLLATAIGILQMMSQVQLGEDHRENLVIIAEELRARFAIEKDSMQVEEIVIQNPETGEDEILYRPPGGVMGDEDNPEKGEAPAVDSE